MANMFSCVNISIEWSSIMYKIEDHMSDGKKPSKKQTLDDLLITPVSI